MIHTIKGNDWDGPFSIEKQKEALSVLEDGHVLYLPNLLFALEPKENNLLSPQYADPKSKNIGYDQNIKKVTGVQGSNQDVSLFQALLERYSAKAQTLLRSLLPHYEGNLEKGRTSFRPTEIRGRSSSYRKDDTRLHVDAFPSTPVQGKRILRVFTNINSHSEGRLWRLGEPFHRVVERFMPHCHRPFPGSQQFLKLLHITKTCRTPYDHYMLQLHNSMKADTAYQREVQQIEFSFPPQSTWIVYTDVTSHAAMQGQYALEQTFYLPVDAMSVPEKAPLRILETFLGRSLLSSI